MPEPVFVDKNKNGSLTISQFMHGYLVQRTYYGHSKKDAVAKFRNEMAKVKKVS